MSSSKTEKPTPKKKRDAAQKGQSFKSKELVTTILILTGASYLINIINFDRLFSLWQNIITNQFTTGIHGYVSALFLAAAEIFIPFLLLCIVASVLPTLLQTGFMIAAKALRLNFDALNPVNGFKKLFSLRTLKDSIKTTLYLLCFLAAAVIFWNNEKQLIFSMVNTSGSQVFLIWAKLLGSLVMTCLMLALCVVVLDALAEYFLHIKDLRMDKQEVKREYKEQEGSPEIKSKRKQRHMEILSEQVRSDVKNSRLIIANPTHIAVGIYVNKEIVGIPFISVLETNARALAVRKYAQSVGVPVVENIALARRIYRTHKRYSFVNMEELDEVMQLLIWLEQVEQAWMMEHPQAGSEQQNDSETSDGENISVPPETDNKV